MNPKFKTISLEDGMPSIPEARGRLTRELHVARVSGLVLLKIIHGYGSSGVGGDLRIALQANITTDAGTRRSPRMYLRRRLARQRRAHVGVDETFPRPEK